MPFDLQVIVSHNNNQQAQVSIVGPGHRNNHVLLQQHINNSGDHGNGTFVDSADDNPPPPPPRYMLIRGLPYMTSAVVVRGVPRKQTKGTKSADL